MVRFAHLHCHSHFSLLEATTRIDELCKAAADDGQERIALTDHGNLFGAVQFYQEATRLSLVPIIGCELNVAARDRKERDPRQPVHHLTVLAENQVGYKNLMRLVSNGYLEGFYFNPRVDKELLAAHSEGLIALSGCMSGEISSKVLAGDIQGAQKVVSEYTDIFGRDQFFIEVMENEIPLQRKQREGLLEVANKTGTTAVLTNDIHYLKSEHSAAREVLMCISSNRTLESENRPTLETDKHHFRTTEEMATLFKGADRLCENAFEVASRCNVTLQFDQFHLPHFDIPSGEDSVQYFRKKCQTGLEKRYGTVDDQISARLDYETAVIEEMGFTAYFLIVADFIRHAREQNIPVGPGRGSAAGSIVAYCLGITDVDPLAYDLLFERFLNRGRVSMPDIDIDFCRNGREEVINYVQEKYGRENVCQIVTFGTLGAKAAIRDTGRVLGMDISTVDRISKKIPEIVGTKLRDAIQQDEDLKAMATEDPKIKQLFDISMSIEGLNRHTSTHAAGVVIADRSLENYVPLCRVQKEINTQYSMNELESIGLLKMDFLGLKTLTVLDRAQSLVRDSGHEIELETLPLDNQAAYEMLQEGATTGVFQLESSGMRELLKKMKPDCFEDIIAILALYRPGPLGSGMVESFVNRKHGIEEIEYLHPSLEDILKSTYGVMVYQEQIMRISNALAGFSLEEADNLRKAMGKKKPEVMEKFKTKFIDGSIKSGATERVAKDIWEQMAFFAGYGFNKSHTVAYGILTYRTAWLKANYAIEFLAACMSIDRGDTDKISVYLDECRRSEIPVLTPDLNESALDFTIRDDTIRFGLGAIKGVGERPVEAILEARARMKRPFETLLEVFEEADHTAMTRGVWEAFIQAGALDWTGQPRARIMSGLDKLVRMGKEHQHDRMSGQGSLFGESTHKAATSDRWLPETPEWSDLEKLAREKDVLGFYLSDHPLRQYGQILSNFSTHQIEDLENTEGIDEVVVGGMVQGKTIRITKSGRSEGHPMAIFRIGGLGGRSLAAVCFAEQYKELQETIEDDAICLFTGKVDRRRDEAQLIVSKVESIHHLMSRRVAKVILDLQSPSNDTLDRIKNTIQDHPGNTAVYLRIHDGTAKDDVIRCGQQYRILVTEDSLNALSSVVEKDNILIR